MTRRSGKVKLPSMVREATGEVKGARQKGTEGTAKRAEDEIKKRMRSTEDRPLPQEPPD